MPEDKSVIERERVAINGAAVADRDRDDDPCCCARERRHAAHVEKQEHGEARNHDYRARADGRGDKDNRAPAGTDSGSSPAATRPGVPADPAVADDAVRTQIRILPMDCATEEAMIRKKLAEMPGVKGLDFNLVQRSVTVSHGPGSLEAIQSAIRTLGFTPEIPEPGGPPAAPAEPIRKPRLPLALAGVATVASETSSWLTQPVWLNAARTLLVVIACVMTTYRKGWIAM